MSLQHVRRGKKSCKGTIKAERTNLILNESMKSHKLIQIFHFTLCANSSGKTKSRKVIC